MMSSGCLGRGWCTHFERKAKEISDPNIEERRLRGRFSGKIPFRMVKPFPQWSYLMVNGNWCQQSVLPFPARTEASET